MSEIDERLAEDPGPESLDVLILCARHPSSDVRWRALSALARIRFKRVMTVAEHDKLKAVVGLANKDPELDVRQGGGWLSQTLEHWENFDSPEAAERREAHRKRVEEKDTSGFIVNMILGMTAALIVILGLTAFFGGGRGKKRKR